MLVSFSRHSYDLLKQLLVCIQAQIKNHSRNGSMLQTTCSNSSQKHHHQPQKCLQVFMISAGGSICATGNISRQSLILNVLSNSIPPLVHFIMGWVTHTTASRSTSKPSTISIGRCNWFPIIPTSILGGAELTIGSRHISKR